MAKINYNKVEQELNEALRKMYIKKLMQGESSVSKRAVSYYGMDSGPRPKPQDAVIEELAAIEKEEKEFERKEIERMKQALAAQQKEKEEILGGLQSYAKEGVSLEQQGEDLIEEQTKKFEGEAKELSGPDVPQAPPTAVQEIEQIPTIDETESPLPPLLLVRRLILWMKKKRLVDLYKLLGTSEEEVAALKLKETVTPEEEKRILEILQQGKTVKTKILKKLGLEDNQKIVDKEYKKQKTKRFNIKDNWLPM